MNWLFCPTGSWDPVSACTCLPSGGQWFALCAPFPYGSKKRCWFFSLFSLFLVRTQWRLRAPSMQNWKSGVPTAFVFSSTYWLLFLLVSLISFLYTFIIIQLEILPQFSTSPFSAFVRWASHWQRFLVSIPCTRLARPWLGALSATSRLSPLSPPSNLYTSLSC